MKIQQTQLSAFLCLPLVWLQTDPMDWTSWLKRVRRAHNALVNLMQNAEVCSRSLLWYVDRGTVNSEWLPRFNCRPEPQCYCKTFWKIDPKTLWAWRAVWTISPFSSLVSSHNLQSNFCVWEVTHDTVLEFLPKCSNYLPSFFVLQCPAIGKERCTDLRFFFSLILSKKD